MNTVTGFTSAMPEYKIETAIFDTEDIVEDCTVLVIDHGKNRDCEVIWFESGAFPDQNTSDLEHCSIYKHCVVQIWKNSVTGESSVGWFNKGG